MARDELKTELFMHRRFLKPVETVDELPVGGPREGFLCFVNSECAIYELVDGKWFKLASADESAENS
ncbi:MAG: hypothetical protein HN348_20050 [Proteobacteria bacterium]|jgi:hypothetical protein|nr:hypothetical protein [Pseudomonadota bacterium]